MSYIKVDAVKIRCDYPGCTTETFDLGSDFAFWADAQNADDDWNNADGQRFDYGFVLFHLCVDHTVDAEEV